MQDLGASLFYKAKFTIQTADGQAEDLLWKLVMEIRYWITSKLNRRNELPVIDSSLRQWSFFKKGGKFYDLQHLNRVYAESVYHQANDSCESVSWACKIVEKPNVENGSAPREWITEIGYKAISVNSAEISYVVTFIDMAGFIGFVQEVPPPTLPRVMRKLLEDEKLVCTVGQNKIHYSAIELEDGDYPRFEEVLLDPCRELPIIYISPYYDDEDEHEGTLVDPDKIAKSVAANALVYYSNSLGFTQEMNYMCNQNYLCSGGAIRVYRPNINQENASDASRHRYLSARFIQTHGEDRIIDLFRRAMAQDVHFYEKMFRVSDCKALLNADAYNQRIDAIREETQGKIDVADTLFIIESDKRINAELACEKLEEENSLLKTEKFNIEFRLKEREKAAAAADAIKASVQKTRSINKYPNTPQAIAHYFETVFPERITFTERAYSSMDDCTTKNEILWEVFHFMATVLYDLLKSNPANAYDEFYHQTGWEIGRSEGRQTHKDPKMMRQYVDTYRDPKENIDHKIDIEAHVKNGIRESDPKFVRIYFAYDPNVADKLIIGHCGKHLKNFSSQKARR